MKTLMLTATAVALFAGISVASPQQDAPKMAGMPKSEAKGPAKKAGTPLVCPVTGTKIASAGKAYAKETYKGKTYYFCCPECKPRFDKNRAGIVKNAAKGKYEAM